MERHKHRRRKYEFSEYIRNRALEKSMYRCEECGKTNRLEAHHIVPIAIALMIPELSLPVIISLANCKILCHGCHVRHHQQNSQVKDYILEIERLLSMDTKPMFPQHSFAGR